MPKLAAALDFGTSKVVLATGRLEDNGAVAFTAAEQAAYAGFDGHEWLDAHSLESAIIQVKRQTQAKTGRRISRAYVAVPGEFIRVLFDRVEVETGAAGVVRPEDIQRLLAPVQADEPPEKYVPLHRTPIAYIINGQTWHREPVGERAQWLGAYISRVYASSVFINDIALTLSELGIAVSGYVAAPLATGHLLRLADALKRTAVVVDAGHFSTDIIVAEGQGIIFHTNLPTGGAHVTLEISQQLGEPFLQAQARKHKLNLGLGRVPAGGADSQADAAARAICEQWLHSLAGSIHDELERFGLVEDARMPYYICGGAIGQLRGARELLSYALGKTCKVYTPDLPITTGTQFTAAAGALTYALTVMGSEMPQGFFEWLKTQF